MTTLPAYQVWCQSCDSVYCPAIKSPVWWKAHQRALKGYLDALCVTGKECGCQTEMQMPELPKSGYYVFGYTMDCRDFVYKCTTFVDLCKVVRKLRNADTFFVKGVSQKTIDRLEGWTPACEVRKSNESL